MMTDDEKEVIYLHIPKTDMSTSVLVVIQYLILI